MADLEQLDQRFRRSSLDDPEKIKRDLRDQSAGNNKLFKEFREQLDEHEARLDSLEGTGESLIVNEGLITDAIGDGLIT